VINLREGRLTLRDYADEIIAIEPMATVTINGKDVDVFVDTGYTGWMDGPLSLARELNLPLTSEDTPVMRGVGYSGKYPY